MEMKTEADHNDPTDCSHDDKPSTGMFAVYFLSVYSVYLVCCYLWPARKSYRSIVFIRSTSKSRPNNIRGGKMSVRPSVRTSTKSFFDLNEI